MAAARQLVKTWREVFGAEQPTVLLGVLADKEVTAVCQALAPLAERFVAVPVRSGRAGPVEALEATLRTVAPGVEVCTAASLEAGLAMAGDEPILITGSLFLVGEALALLDGVPMETVSTQ
jgi:dihydrofolate synthase/folylpolyglutamate synthase